MSQRLHTRRLVLSWSTSRGQGTYGYNICRLDDRKTNRRNRCMGGGYDMVGTVFADWLQECMADRLKAIKDRAFYTFNKQQSSKGLQRHETAESLYGMTANYLGAECYSVTLDGGFGLSSMIAIAEACGLEVQTLHDRKGHTEGFIVSWPAADGEEL